MHHTSEKGNAASQLVLASIAMSSHRLVADQVAVHRMRAVSNYVFLAERLDHEFLERRQFLPGWIGRVPRLGFAGSVRSPLPQQLDPLRERRLGCCSRRDPCIV